MAVGFRWRWPALSRRPPQSGLPWPRFPSHRVAGGSHPPPAPTERSVRISRTTLFGESFTAKHMLGTAGLADSSVVALAQCELSRLFVRVLLP